MLSICKGTDLYMQDVVNVLMSHTPPDIPIVHDMGKGGQKQSSFP